MSYRSIIIGIVILLLLNAVVLPQDKSTKVKLDRSGNLEVLYEKDQYVTYVKHDVVFETETGFIYCDSAIFVKGVYVNLMGNVVVDDEDYKLSADSVYYDILTGEAVARGSFVELWSYDDSLYASGVHAYYNRERKEFEMEDRPIIYINYPDTNRMIEILSDFVHYNSNYRKAEATGDVKITHGDLVAESQCAVMDIQKNMLDLFDNPVARKKNSEIKGEFISIKYQGELLRQIDVIDSAFGEFTEPVDSLGVFYDRSILSGDRIIINFYFGTMDNIICYGQAYSWYYPSLRGGRDYNENSVSGDTIKFFLEQNQLQSVKVVGGVVGTYLSGRLRDTTKIIDEELSIKDSLIEVARELLKERDTTYTEKENPQNSIQPDKPDINISDTIAIESISLTAFEADSTDSLDPIKRISPSDTLDLVTIDSIDYSGSFVEYSLFDSTIYLHQSCNIKSGEMSLQAHEVQFDTQNKLIKAFSAQEKYTDSTYAADTLSTLAADLQPATIPVILNDGNDELYGDFLEYSTDTEKGRIVQSKSKYEKGIYYGKKLFREQKDIFYVKDGYYTTCDADEPHFHFKSSHMKLMENNKMIVRPVVFYIGRMPILAIPYYVFPLKKGRHSGFLPFRFGNFERGDRYVSDVGYYWSASEYWDWQGAVDYHEKNRTITFKNRVNFNKRYVFNGYINAEYRRQTRYNSSIALESPEISYKFNGSYKHIFSPSFTIDGSGSYTSTSSYDKDFSNNLEERLNRDLSSKMNFTKTFSNGLSLTGYFNHVENLDNETRTDILPTLTASLPTIWLFGSGSKDENGTKVHKWYNDFIFKYSPSVTNYSYRKTVDSSFVAYIDTSYVTDTLGVIIDTNFTEVKDTTSYRSRKKYVRVNHSPSLNLPGIKLFKYIDIKPALNYSETWYKIIETDQSQTQGIDASKIYKSYSYSGSVSMKTDLYGTINPNIGSLQGLRHVFTPTISYTWSPEIDMNPKIRAFAGGGASSSKQSSISFKFNNLFQAKTIVEEKEKTLNLLNLSTGFSYNFENKEKPLSNMTTTFSISSIPGITLGGDMTHSFYDPVTDEEKFFSPFLMNWGMNLSFNLKGGTFLFDEEITGIPKGADSAHQVGGTQTNAQVSGRRGWNMRVSFSFNEDDLHTSNYRKNSQVSTNLGFNVTPTTSVTYVQTYNVVGKKIVNKSINIVRILHCWTGSMYWVPSGSNRGFGFKLNVTDIPDIKLDSNHDTFQASSFNPAGF